MIRADERYTNDQPIFRDAGHALHVSYLLHSLPVRTVSATAIVIDRLVKENNVWDGIPVRVEGSVNFSGLTPLEVRVQCAMVVGMVSHLGHPAERAACQAIYGLQAIKGEGVRGMAQYLGPMLAMGGEYPLYVCWHVFMRPHQRLGVTQGDVAKKFGLQTKQVEHDCSRVRKTAFALHARALTALQDRFVSGGLVPSECAV